jgi:hypothetical protein
MAKAANGKPASVEKAISKLVEALAKAMAIEEKLIEKLSEVLARIPALTDTYGCCTFKMGGQTYHANMTKAHCVGLNPPGSWSPNPC